MTTPRSDFDIIVSAENNYFMAWQCMVFHYSAQTSLGRTPLFVVHGDEPELVDGFEQIRNVGGRIQRAPNFRHAGDIMYAPRNQMKTVELARSDKPWLVLCDADMIFLDHVDFASIIEGLDDTTIALDRIPFLVVHDGNHELLRDVARKVEIPFDHLVDHPINGATPHLISMNIRDELCAQWDPMMETYLASAYAHHEGYDPNVWISSMWGLVLAMHRLGIDAELLDLCVHTEMDPPIDPSERPIVHYSYPNDGFHKRRYNEPSRDSELWQASGTPGHTSGAICDAIRATAAYYQRGER